MTLLQRAKRQFADRRPGPRAETAQGPVRGKLESKGRITTFHSVPYAAPPVGERRWRPPGPAPERSEPLDCTRSGPIAFQRSQRMDEFVQLMVGGLGLGTAKQKAIQTAVKAIPRKQSEDCLTLTIRTPTAATDLPVMVWIHGGDHTDGAGSDPFYASSVLPERGCVLVSINYRLGLFGFLAHPELSAESAEGVSGNYGLLDQIAALEWIRDNIANFGGDPARVTIFGESAGGEAVLNLMTAPRARGLFHAAIAQSPSDSGRWLHLDRPALSLDSATDAGQTFARSLVGDGAGQIERLRAMEPAELSDHYRADLQAGRHFYPAVDGVVLPTTPMTAFSQGKQAGVPLIVGYNADEGSLLATFTHPAGAEFGPPPDPPLTPEATLAAFADSYGAVERAERLFAAYPGLQTGDPAAVETHFGDHMFGVHVDHASRLHAQAGHPVFRYHFRAVPPSPKQTIGAFHAAEVFYVFDTAFPMAPTAVDGHLLAREMGDRWFAFAASHDPNAPGRPTWPRYDPATSQHMVFDRPKSSVQDCPEQPGLDVMRERIDHLSQVLDQPAASLPSGNTT